MLESRKGAQVTAAINPWGRLATFGFAFVAMVGGQIGALFGLAWLFGVPIARLPNFGDDGFVVALIILISTPIQVMLIAAFARMSGSNPIAYLGLTWPRRSEIVFGVLATVAIIIVGNLISWLFGKNIVTAFQSDVFRTASAAGWLPLVLLWFAIVVVTPIGEETVFRGFLFRGWLRKPRDAWPVIAVTAALWALIHLQYDWYVTGQIFAFGLVIGWMRWATGSTILTILLHALINVEGMLETIVASWLK